MICIVRRRSSATPPSCNPPAERKASPRLPAATDCIPRNGFSACSISCQVDVAASTRIARSTKSKGWCAKYVLAPAQSVGNSTLSR